MRRAFGSIAIGVLVLVSCARLTPASGVAPASPDLEEEATVASASPTATPSYQPGGVLISGVVVRRSPIGVVIEQLGVETEVDLRSVIDIWRETSLPASAIEVGDDLMARTDPWRSSPATSTRTSGGSTARSERSTATICSSRTTAPASPVAKCASSCRGMWRSSSSVQQANVRPGPPI